MNLFRITLIAFAFICSSISITSAQNFTGKKITDIQINYIGAKTVDAQRIKNFMSSSVGSTYTPDKLDNDLRTLYKTGLIDNVNIKGSNHAGGVRLTAQVATRPLLASMGFKGNIKYQDKTLARKTKLKTGTIIGASDEVDARKALEDHYTSSGYPDITITSKLQKTNTPGYANIIFTISEGAKNTVSKIRFEGNRAFDRNILKKEIKTRKKDIFTFFTKSGEIDNDQLAEDVESIIEFYKNNGYLRASSPGARIIPQANGRIQIIIPISEGIKYDVANISFENMRLFTEDQIRPTLVLDPGDAYSLKQMREDIITIRAYYGSRGYADVRVAPIITNAARGSVNIRYSITEGGPSKVGRVNVSGNSVTRDKVIRREITLRPGEPFNSVELDTIRNRIKSLNYFDPVFVSDKKSNQPGHRDIDISVKEQKTGSFTFGAGLSSIDSVVGFIGLEQRNFDITNFRNFRGGGQRLSLNIRAGGETTDASISLIEPWFFGKQLEAGAKLFYKDLLFLSDEYELTEAGGAVHLRKAVGKKSSIRGELKWESNDVRVEDDLAGTGSEFEQFDGRFERAAFTLSYIYESRNSRVQPRKGHKVDIGLTYSFGDTESYTFSAQGSKHWNFKWDTILTLRGEFKTTKDLANDELIPIFDRHFLGGARNLRGFEFNDIGPRDAVTNEVFGGATSAFTTAEVTFPIIQNVRGAVFADVGSVSENSWSIDDLYFDAGIGLRLNLPIGPLAVDYAFPLSSPDEEADNGAQFNFYIDTAF